MALFTWNPSYSIDVSQIDAEHRQLFVLAEQLYEAMRTGSSKKAVEDTLSGLIGYCSVHFRHEEEVMRKIGYPDLPEHRRVHEELTRKVQDFERELRAGRVALSLDLLQFLKNWLVQHISGCDSRIAHHLKQTGDPAVCRV